MLEAVGLVKHYASRGGARVQAIDGVDLSVAHGELVVLLGPSGSGKTTLLELIAGVLRPDRGTVAVDGREVSGLSEDEGDIYRLHVLGVVPQSLRLIEGPNAIDLAALRLAAMGVSWAEGRRRVEPLLTRLGLRDRVEHDVEALSKGEIQRVAIAMALATQPRLILADEPTANLDSEWVHKVLALLVEVCREQDAAVVLVTHDERATKVADRVLELRDGQLTEVVSAGAADVPRSNSR